MTGDHQLVAGSIKVDRRGGHRRRADRQLPGDGHGPADRNPRPGCARRPGPRQVARRGAGHPGTVRRCDRDGLAGLGRHDSDASRAGSASRSRFRADRDARRHRPRRRDPAARDRPRRATGRPGAGGSRRRGGPAARDDPPRARPSMRTRPRCGPSSSATTSTNSSSACRSRPPATEGPQATLTRRWAAAVASASAFRYASATSG